MAVILRYFSEFGYLPGVLRKSSRSLSHLLVSSCLLLRNGVKKRYTLPVISKVLGLFAPRTVRPMDVSPLNNMDISPHGEFAP